MSVIRARVLRRSQFKLELVGLAHEGVRESVSLGLLTLDNS